MGGTRHPSNPKLALQKLPVTAVMSLTVSVIMFLAWIAYFTKQSVRNSAFTYAEMLLRACDILTPKRNPSRVRPGN